MDFELIISPRANNEIAQAYAFYAERSKQALENFDNEILSAYNTLELNPFFQIKYKNTRAFPLKSFPYIFFFTTDESSKKVFIRAFFQTSQNTNKYP